MINLHWKTNGLTRNLIPKPFNSEAEFEAYVFGNQELLGDVSILHRQIRAGNKQNIPDMLGVDLDSRVCIIEMKNVEVGEDILPQVLGYALWADANPDSIKAIWLESKNRPEDLEIEWDKLEIRIIVVAPSFRAEIPRMAAKIGYPIDLVKIQRFGFEKGDEFLLVEQLEEPQSPKVGVTRVMEDWTWEYYEKEHGKEATGNFRHAVEYLAAFVKRQDWDLPYELKKYYTGFKLGNRVVFNVAWGGTHAWNVRVKIPEKQAKAFQGSNWEFQRFESSFNEAVFKPKTNNIADLSELETILTAAYHRISGIQ